MNENDWRKVRLEQFRQLIRAAIPGVSEEAKWKRASNPSGVPTWSANGIICTGEIYKDKVKLTFGKGARLADPAGLFNASLDGNLRRAIDLFEADELDEAAITALLRRAAQANGAA
ncbi:MAG: DUF1801 domain-containing protein [Novosphingobium sp.]